MPSLLIGAVAGILAKLILPARVRGDFTGAMLAGIMGSFVAGVFARVLGGGAGLVASVVGAVTLAVAFQLAVRLGQKRHVPTRTEDRIPAA